MRHKNCLLLFFLSVLKSEASCFPCQDPKSRIPSFCPSQHSNGNLFLPLILRAYHFQMQLQSSHLLPKDSISDCPPEAFICVSHQLWKHMICQTAILFAPKPAVLNRTYLKSFLTFLISIPAYSMCNLILQTLISTYLGVVPFSPFLQFKSKQTLPSLEQQSSCSFQLYSLPLQALQHILLSNYFSSLSWSFLLETMIQSLLCISFFPFAGLHTSTILPFSIQWSASYALPVPTYLLSSFLIQLYTMPHCPPHFYSLFLPCLLVNSMLSSRLIPSFYKKFSNSHSILLLSRLPAFVQGKDGQFCSFYLP